MKMLKRNLLGFQCLFPLSKDKLQLCFDKDRTPIYGLEKKQGYYCKLCYSNNVEYAALSQHSIRLHVCRKHDDVGIDYRLICKSCTVQSFGPSLCNKYYIVKDTVSIINVKDLDTKANLVLSAMKATIEGEAHESSDASDVKTINSFLDACRWSQHVDKLSEVDFTIISQSTRPAILTAVTDYFVKMQLDMVELSYHILKMIKSKKVNEVESFGFKPLQQSCSVNTYVTVLANFVEFLFQYVEKFEQLPMLSKYELPTTLVSIVKEAIANNSSSIDVHCILKSVFFVEFKVSTSRYQNPSLQFVIYRNMSERFRGFRVDSVANDISIMLYSMRVVVLNEALIINDLSMDLLHYIREDINTPFESLRNCSKLAASITSQNSRLPRVIWVDNEKYDEMLIDGKKISISKMKIIYWNAFEKARKQVGSGLLSQQHTSVLPLVDMCTLYDSLRDDSHGYGFHVDPTNTGVIYTKESLGVVNIPQKCSH